MKLVSLMSVLLNAYISYASDVEIGLFTTNSPSKAIFTPSSGSYTVYSDKKQIYFIENQDLLHISLKDGLIVIQSLTDSIGSYSKISIVSNDSESSFKLKPVIPYNQTRTYDDGLKITINGSSLKIINMVDIDKYVAGVVRSEVGVNSSKEFYKVQAIICRTYALGNFRRHEDDGFQLCDKVHCQVYGGRFDQQDPLTGISYSGTDNILQAAMATSGFIMVDSSIELINASFHSNCGGQTLNSEDVWTLSKPYLTSVTDSFCQNQRNAKWEMQISIDKWINYLEKVYNYSVNDSASRERALHFSPSERTLYFAGNKNIPLKKIREDWGLRSTYFSCEQKGSRLLLYGRGYGHGVGLCQEGAMHRAKLGYSYQNILQYYYKGVNIIDVASLRFLLK